MPGAGAVVASSAPASACPNGGITVTDGSGDIGYVCNGANGSPGPTGAAGPGVTYNAGSAMIPAAEPAVCPSFSTAMPDTNYAVTVTPTDNSALEGLVLEPYEKGTGGFCVGVFTSSGVLSDGSAAITFDWIAIEDN